MTPEDEADYDRLEKLLDRLGKAIILSAEHEISEIIRRRLFEWDLRQVGKRGQVLLSHDAMKTCNEYAHWLNTYRQAFPNWFPVDHANETFAAAYPFHPTVLSVFERKWQGVPRFQRTRGVLRMLALWVSHAYQQGYRGAHRDPLIDLGTAPLDDPLFRGAVFEQLGETRLEVPVTTDICGSQDAHAQRLDADAVDTIRKNRLHRKVAATIFFESNGGQARGYATLPEVRLGVTAPNLDITNVETVLEALAPPDGACYYLHTEKNRYWFSIKPTLTRILADRKASIPTERIQERVEAEVQAVFRKGAPLTPTFFPDTSGQVPDRPALTFVVLRVDQSPHDPATLDWLEKMTQASEAFTRVRTPQPTSREQDKIHEVIRAASQTQVPAYVDKLGTQLLILKGRGGTGKTATLLKLALLLYEHREARVLLLTYNRALVSDLRRLLAFMDIRDGIAQQSIAVQTVHSFFFQLLRGFDVIGSPCPDFLERYEEYKAMLMLVLPPAGISLDAVEISLLRQALDLAGGNKTRAAELLGVSRQTLLYRLDKYQIEGG